MTDSKLMEHKLAGFGRSFSLLFNRATIYESDHPYFNQSVEEFTVVVQELVKLISPLVFIMNQEQFYVDEEPLDPRINTGRMVAHFKKAGIQSVSFYNGIDKKEIMAFVGVFTSLRKYPTAEDMQKTLHSRRVEHLKINHVFFKKVATDEEIVARGALEKLSPDMDVEKQVSSKKLFLDMILESVMMEEFEKTLTINNLVKNPVGLSKNMVDSDLTCFRKSDAEDKRPGLILEHQLQVIGEKVEESLSGEGNADLKDLAAAVIDMKRQLAHEIETQKALGIAYSNEEVVLDKANEITDKVIIKLVKDEYKSGEISTERMAQILRRLVPEMDELKRLLPKIKEALLEEGMPLSEYLNLVQGLARELQNEELSKVLQESAEMIGIDGEGLIQDITSNPGQAAELIFLAAEIRKSGGDEKELTDLLVDYVEQLGPKLAVGIAKKDGVDSEEGLRQVMTDVESGIVGRLKGMDVKDDVLERLEEKLNERIDEIFEKIKEEWISSQPGMPTEDGGEERSVLQILEQSVGESGELGNILRTIRSDAEFRGIDENDFKEIYTEIVNQKRRKQKQRARKKMPPGILNPQSLMFILEKEIFRASRYDLPFAALSFSVVLAKPKKPVPPGTITHQSVVDAILEKLTTNVRGADLAGQLGKNKVVALLPMTSKTESKFALRRHLRMLNTESVEIKGVPLDVQIAGVATNFEPESMPDAAAFLKTLSYNLSEMVARIKNIHQLV